MPGSPFPGGAGTRGVFGRSVRLQSGVRSEGMGVEEDWGGEGRAGAAVHLGCSRFRRRHRLAHPPGASTAAGHPRSTLFTTELCPPGRALADPESARETSPFLVLMFLSAFLTWILGALAPESTKVLLLMDVPSIPQVRYVLVGPKVVPAVGTEREGQRQW